MMKKHKDGEHV